MNFSLYNIFHFFTLQLNVDEIYYIIRVITSHYASSSREYKYYNFS